MDRQTQGATIAVSGLLLAAVQVVHATTRTTTTVGFLVDAVPFALMGLAITYAGVWVARNDEFDAGVPVVGAWAVGGALGFAAIAALILFSLNVAVDYPVLDSAVYVTMDNVTAGALAGLLVGLYDAQSRTRFAELERQRDRVESFANRAADLNTYGRALNQCSTLEEVAALCVEAVVTLVDLRDAAVVERRGDATTFVEGTMVGVDDAVVGTLADRATGADPATIQRVAGDLPAGVPDGVAKVLVILVTETDGAAVAIVAFDRDGGDLPEESASLLELLVSHAGTALENIYRTRAATREETDIDIED